MTLLRVSHFRRTIAAALALCAICAGYWSTAHAGEFRILQTNQLPEEQLLDQPKGRVLICGGWADGLVEGLTGSILSYGDNAEPYSVATAVVTGVDEHESVCEFTAATKTTAITKQLWVRLETPALSLADIFALAIAAFDTRGYARALHYYEQVVQQEPDNDLSVERIPICRGKIEEARMRPVSDSERVAERGRIGEYVEIAHSYRTYRQCGRAHAFVDKILRVDSSNEQALALREIMPDTVDHAFAPPYAVLREESVVDDATCPPVDVAAKMVQYGSPDYPDRALAEGRHGVAMIKTLVASSGSAVYSGIMASSGDTSLDRAALEAAPYCKYRPAMLNHRPVASWFSYEVSFKTVDYEPVPRVDTSQPGQSAADSLERLPGPDDSLTVETLAEMIDYEPPHYPSLCVAAGREGVVWIKSLVSSSGSVRDAVVFKSSGESLLDQAALAVAPKCKFKPARQGGRAVAMWVTYKVDFDLKGDPSEFWGEVPPVSHNAGGKGSHVVPDSVPVDTAAEIVHLEPPIRPKQVENKEGTVWIKVLVESDGSVRDASIRQSSGDHLLDIAALDAAPKSRFKPAAKDGEPVDTWLTYPVEFKASEGLSALPSEPSPSEAANQDSTGEYLPAIDEFVSVERIAEMIYFKTPDYPRIAQQAGMEGTVWIKALVGSTGAVRDAVISKTSGNTLLDQAALDAASKCRFKPAVWKGREAAMWVTYKVEFTLGQ